MSYLDVRLPGFLPHELTGGETRHQGPIIVRENSLELVRDGLGDMVFHGWAVRISVEAPSVNTPVPTNSIAGMVQRRNMALGH